MRGENEHMQRVALVGPIMGAPKPSDFQVIEEPIRPLAEGEALLATRFVSVDPGTRSRLSAAASYARPLQAGETIDGFCVGEVVESLNPKFALGERYAYGGGWASHMITNGRGYLQKLPVSDVSPSLWIGVLGVPGMTAYFGLKRIAGLKAEDRVLITSAAGPVGATAGQLAKAWGAARVVGVAGGALKGSWVHNEAGFDACVDYKASGDLTEALRAASPEGYDVLFDNVGNAMIDAVLPLMRPGGRIVVSGQVGDYNEADPPGLKGTRYFIASRLRMEGIVVFDDLRQFSAAQADVSAMIQTGQIKYREERFSGLASAPAAFCGLFTGEAFGRRIVEL